MKKLILTTALCIAFPCYATGCDNYQLDKAEYYAEIQGKEIAHKYQGTKNIYTNITSCEYNSYTNKYKVGIDINWKGSLTGDAYNASGIMTLDFANGRRDFTETYRNQNLENWTSDRIWIGIVGAAIAAGMENSK